MQSDTLIFSVLVLVSLTQAPYTTALTLVCPVIFIFACTYEKQVCSTHTYSEFSTEVVLHTHFELYFSR